MHHLLVYGDSLTWGIVPDSRRRLAFDERWPGILENRMNQSGLRVRITEDCINGRRTVWDDPFKPGRNGLHGIQQRIEACSPLSLVILMLGSNDFQFCHPFNDAAMSAQGIATLVQHIRLAPIEPGMPVPPILIVCPPRMEQPRGFIAPKFRGAETRCGGLAEAYAQTASALGCHFFDANNVISVSKVDGIHLDADQHPLLGAALLPVVESILSTSPAR